MKFLEKIGFIFFAFLPFCACENANSVSILFPQDPDTTGIPELINFVDQDYIDALIDQETRLSNGNKRFRGIRVVPQDGDDFRRVSLDEVYWPGVSVIEGDFRGSSLRSGRCYKGSFQRSDFRGADIRWTQFDYSRLDSSDFSQSQLFHVHANMASFHRSNFRGANMFGMEAHFANFRACDFSGALMKDSEFLESDFSTSVGINAKLFRAVLKDSKIDSCDFSFADFTGAGLEESTFIDTRLWFANFQGAHLQGCNFRGADLKGCNFFGAEFETTDFNGVLNIPEEILGFLDENGYATGVWQDSNKNAN